MNFNNLNYGDSFVFYNDVVVFFEALYQGREEAALYKKVNVNGCPKALNLKTSSTQTVYDNQKVIKICC
ncbi:MAG: hypothetical protein HYX21_02815 [Candidatus Yanofskybacteria bacterium]|nr:hypothetical protein [Candidatus Yanofskybacteria bacterium]